MFRKAGPRGNIFVRIYTALIPALSRPVIPQWLLRRRGIWLRHRCPAQLWCQSKELNIWYYL